MTYRIRFQDAEHYEEWIGQAHYVKLIWVNNSVKISSNAVNPINSRYPSCFFRLKTHQ